MHSPKILPVAYLHRAGTYGPANVLLFLSPGPTSLPYPHITPLKFGSFSLHAVLHRFLRRSRR